MPTIKLPSIFNSFPKFPKIQLPHVSLPNIPAVPLHLPEIKMPKLPDKIAEYVEKGIEIGFRKGVDKGMDSAEESITHPMRVTMEEIAKQTNEMSEKYIGNDAVKALGAVKIIAARRTAPCIGRISECFHSIKNGKAACEKLFNLCYRPQRPEA
jgi:hypothetical protein